MKEPINQLNKLKPKSLDSIDSSWVDIWNKEISNNCFCLITFYNIKHHLSKEDLNWCQILVTNALPSAIGENICNVLKINLQVWDGYNEDIIWNMKIYREIAQEYWPEIDTLYEVIIQAKENKKL